MRVKRMKRERKKEGARKEGQLHGQSRKGGNERGRIEGRRG